MSARRRLEQVAAPRFFVEGECRPGETIPLDPADARHARLVLRMQGGDALTIAGNGAVWEARLIISGAKAAHARILRPAAGDAGELPIEVTIIQALTKGEKFDDVVEKSVELGARRIIPASCERSYARADGRKVERWRRIARAAAAQSRRRLVPAVEDIVGFHEAIARRDAWDELVVAYEAAPPESLATVRAAADSRIAIAVGPEGSFTAEEIRAAADAHARFVRLGPTILRTETAASAVLAALASRFW